ncbi:MAG: hypothetical protein ABI759_30505 [Candidatus Solibacter sp.]
MISVAGLEGGGGKVWALIAEGGGAGAGDFGGPLAGATSVAGWGVRGSDGFCAANASGSAGAGPSPRGALKPGLTRDSRFSRWAAAALVFSKPAEYTASTAAELSATRPVAFFGSEPFWGIQLILSDRDAMAI